MSQLPQSQNSHRWEPPQFTGGTGNQLRNGQLDLYEIIRDHVKDDYAIQLPTGYGKSWCACIAYATLRSQGRVNRMLIVVPTDQQRRQYIEGLEEDLSKLGISVSGIECCDTSNAWVHKTSLNNTSEIFVAGIQSISCANGTAKKNSDGGGDPSNLDYYQILMAKGDWLVVADEFHHYAESSRWGEAIKILPYKVKLGMSATPFRNDNKPTIMGNKKFDVVVSLEEAVNDAAIRPIKAIISNYYLTWHGVGEDPQTGTMSDLEKESDGDIKEYERKKSVRYLSKYVSNIFLDVFDAWTEYERSAPNQNQILVFAMTCAHAASIAQIINNVTGYVVEQPFADWVGVQSTEGNSGRPEKENLAVLEQFKSNRLKCLVQVNKAGEGFNNKRCSIGLMLDMVGDTPMKRQHIGRFMRTNEDGGGLPSLIFASEDSPCRTLLENLQQETTLPGEENKTGNIGGADRDVVIPDLFVIDAEWTADRFVWPMGTPGATLKACVEQDPSILDDIAAGITTEEKVIAALEKALVQKAKSEFKPLTSVERRKQLTDQVSRNIGIIINAVIRKRNSGTFSKSARADFFQAVNSRWKKVSGMSHSEMTEEDLKKKNAWLQEVAAIINTEGEPSWLCL